MADPEGMRAQARRWRRDAIAQAPRVAAALCEAADLLEEQADLIEQARGTTVSAACDPIVSEVIALPPA
ncbi:MAG: hypothetical protein JO021_14840 [Alphaproteobacteria bacterium]|nr:hypothetical protein [Alphaproteobacteria bacterium]